MEQNIFYWLNQLPTSARIKAKKFGIKAYKDNGGSIKKASAFSMYIAIVSTGVMGTPQRDYWYKILNAYEAKSHPKNEAAC